MPRVPASPPRPRRHFSTVAAFIGAAALWPGVASAATSPEPLRGLVAGRLEAEYPSLEGIYQNLHAHPELSSMEKKTAALVARKLLTGRKPDFQGVRIREGFPGSSLLSVPLLQVSRPPRPRPPRPRSRRTSRR